MNKPNSASDWSVAILLTGALLVWACTSEIVPATGKKQYLGFSWEQEQQIGKQAAQEIGASFGIYQDAKLQSYVERVGQRVLKESHLRGPGAAVEVAQTPVTFQILDSATVNAMAIPGGHVYVTRGLLAHLISEDQLAFVLGHEIGHVSARHAARQAWQQKLGQGLLLGGAILGQVVGGIPAENILQLGGSAAQLLFLRHSREDELEADSLAVNYTKRADYDPLAVAGFFRALARIQEREGAAIPNFLSTHPDPGNRVQRIGELAGASKRQIKTAAESPYIPVLDGLIIGDDPRQGFVERNTFYHPELRFRLPVPRGFKVVNQAAQLVMIDPQQRAMVGLTAARERTAEAAAKAFLKQPGLRVLETFKSRSGLAGMGAVADAQSENQSIRLVVYFVEHRNQVYQILAYSAPQMFAQFRNEFLAVMQGFGELTEPEILRRQPLRLKVERASRSAPFRSFIPSPLPADLGPEAIAIMNQVAINEQIEQGRTIKIPRTTG